MGFGKIAMRLFGAAKKGISKAVSKTGVGKRIAEGISQGKQASLFKFNGVKSDKTGIVESFQKQVMKKGLGVAQKVSNDKEFTRVLSRYAQKSGLTNVNFAAMSQEEIIETILQKSGVGPCKFAQIISSDETMMNKLSPKLQEIIKRTQSENPFSRTIQEAQAKLNLAFSNSPKALTTSASQIGGGGSPLAVNEFTVIKPLSAGTVGETYLARDTGGKEVIAKMIKKNVDKEQLELEEKIFTRFIEEFAPDNITGQKQIHMLKTLYKDWGKELNFKYEYEYNKLLQNGAKRYKVADITHISPDESCIIMEKAEGIQMNRLMQMLKDYKTNPYTFKQKYADELSKHSWLQDTDKVIDDLPKSITKAFDEMFLFMKKGGKSLMHGDPHMGNYFITAGKDGKLTPVFIDTGNCISRNGAQIKQDIQFLSNYFVGNSKGLAKYFIEQCEQDANFAAKNLLSGNLLPADNNAQKALTEKIAKEIQVNIFDKAQNITNVDAVQRSIQAILEKHGLSMKPEAATAMKAQMQFFTGISEAASLSGRQVDVGTIVKDIPEALYYLVKSRVNPFSTIKPAMSFAYNHQTQASRTAYQFLNNQQSEIYTLSRDFIFNHRKSIQPSLVTCV